MNLPKNPPNPTEHSCTPIDWLGFISTCLYVLRRSHFVLTLITVLLQIHKKKKKKMTTKQGLRASLVAQWIRISLPVQESWVRSLIWEDPTCCRGTCPQHLNLCSRAQEPRLLESKHPRPVLLNQRNHHNEKHGHHNQRKSSAAAQTQENQK